MFKCCACWQGHALLFAVRQQSMIISKCKLGMPGGTTYMAAAGIKYHLEQHRSSATGASDHKLSHTTAPPASEASNDSCSAGKLRGLTCRAAGCLTTP